MSQRVVSSRVESHRLFCLQLADFVTFCSYRLNRPPKNGASAVKLAKNNCRSLINYSEAGSLSRLPCTSLFLLLFRKSFVIQSGFTYFALDASPKNSFTKLCISGYMIYDRLLHKTISFYGNSSQRRQD